MQFNSWEEAKGLWVDALRSGDYTQGRETLTTKIDGGYSYCCLGVLECVIGDGDPEIAESNGYIDDPGRFDMPLNSGYEILNWASSMFPKIKGVVSINASKAGTQDALASLNDTAGLNFAQIADIVEAVL